MSRFFLSLLLVFCLCIAGCQLVGTDDEPGGPGVEPISLRRAPNPDELSLDPYSIVALLNDTTTADLSPFADVAISPFADVAIESDTLRLRVAYDGGCAEHEFTLVAFGYFMESVPPQSGVALAHEARGDTCRRQIETTLQFDLAPLAEELLSPVGKTRDASEEGLGRIVLRPNRLTEERGFPRIEYRFDVDLP